MSSVKVEVASQKHIKYVSEILKTIEDATKVRGTGIAKRKPEYIEQKINEGKAIIAMDGDKFVGFCYIECWDHGKFVANSGLIVKSEYRGMGIAKRIKKAAFELSQKKFPGAKIFGLTRSRRDGTLPTVQPSKSSALTSTARPATWAAFSAWGDMSL